MYDQVLGDRILEVLNGVYPDNLRSEEELRKRLPEYKDTPRDEVFKALDALYGDGAIDGKFLRGGAEDKIEAAALLTITRTGRARVEETKKRQETSSFAGDRRGFSSESTKWMDLEEILPDRPQIPEGISAELAKLLVRAFELTEGRAELDDFSFSFTSILLAFLASDDPLCRWFQEFVSTAGSSFEALLVHRNVPRDLLALVRNKSVGPREFARLLTKLPRPTWTSSAQAVWESALELKRRVNSTEAPLDVRHLMGVYIYRPSGHEKQLEEWGFNRELWSRGFLNHLGVSSEEEAQGWLAIHVELFGAGPVLSGELPQKEETQDRQASHAVDTTVRIPNAEPGTGPSTHVARDRWTIDDSLGHFPYAYAIYRFLTDRETKPPLAISIQAPWGGGKSSLMRMIQSQLDPDALQDERASETEVKATVKDVVKEMEATGKTSRGAVIAAAQVSTTKKVEFEKSSARRFTVPDLKEGGERRVTIWFNAWKYESTAQVWAGLADCIIEQIGERLGPVERELFWFRLQLRRIKTGEVRRKIYEETFGLFCEKVLPSLWKYAFAPCLAIIVALASRLAHWDSLQDAGLAGLVVSCLVEFGIASSKLTEAKEEVDKNPARLTLGEIMETPDYRSNLGFIHEVVEDLKKVFKTIPPKYLPMVIFIDDLDRCSPAKVADVVEALNLFLAGEFPDCMFVLGIDDEMVAAALDKAHSEVIAKLPGYARSTSIGWRFMDKFVQLPFVVPLPGDEDLTHYMESLLSRGRVPSTLDMDARDQAARVVEKGQDDPADSDRVVQEVARKNSLSEKQVGALKKEVEILQDMSRNIKNFSDREEHIRNLIVTGGRQFSNNPRDVKRFINVFRFFYFLRAAREARKEPVPSLDQMSRWIVLSLRWPEVVRWLRRSAVANGFSSNFALREFERLGAANGLLPWQTGAENTLRLKVAEVSWLSDSGLYDFFGQESRLPADQRLSASSGRGFW